MDVRACSPDADDLEPLPMMDDEPVEPSRDEAAEEAAEEEPKVASEAAAVVAPEPEPQRRKKHSAGCELDSIEIDWLLIRHDDDTEAVAQATANAFE